MTPNINSLFPENCKHEMLFTQRELYLTRGQGIVKWNGCESSSLASVMKKPWEGWMTTPFKDVTTQETATAPGNLAADLVFVSFEKVQLLLCHLECQVLTPRGGRDIECSSKTLSSPHRMQSARLLCSVSERATNFTVQKLFVQPETGIRHPRTIFSSHFLIYWGMPGQKKCNRSNHISPSNRKMLQCHYQMRNYSYFLLKLSCCNSSDSENSSDCSEYFGSYWTPKG